jgi:lysophospholipase L1-like esterase
MFALAAALGTAAPALGEPVRILPLGDSITHGYYNGFTVQNSYRKELKNLLDAAGYTTDFVGSLTDGDFTDNQHEGHDGWHADETGSTNDILGRVAEWLSETDEDIVLLHVGTNDILANGEDADEVSDILDEIFATNSDITVVVALIIKADASYSWTGDVSIYNSNLNTMAQARIAGGDDIIVVDMENGAGLLYDSPDMVGFHPSPTGYDKMATNWYPAVTEAIARQHALRAPQIISFAVSNEVVVLGAGNLSVGTTVQVERALLLSEPGWTPVDRFIPAASAAIWTNGASPANEAAFYRLSTP